MVQYCISYSLCFINTVFSLCDTLKFSFWHWIFVSVYAFTVYLFFWYGRNSFLYELDYGSILLFIFNMLWIFHIVWPICSMIVILIFSLNLSTCISLFFFLLSDSVSVCLSVTVFFFCRHVWFFVIRMYVRFYIFILCQNHFLK